MDLLSSFINNADNDISDKAIKNVFFMYLCALHVPLHFTQQCSFVQEKIKNLGFEYPQCADCSYLEMKFLENASEKSGKLIAVNRIDVSHCLFDATKMNKSVCYIVQGDFVVCVHVQSVLRQCLSMGHSITMLKKA